jgi:hypothetical protein
MPRKRTAIILDKPARESGATLESMVVELTGDAPLAANYGARPSHWSRRFAAAGKTQLIKPLRRS